MTATRSDDGTDLLLFHAGGDPTPRAVPLSLVARLEDIERSKIERSDGGLVTQYRGKLMPLIAMGEAGASTTETQAVLVFADGERIMGLMVDTIVDVVHAKLNIELASATPGTLGTAIVAGQAAEVLDTGYWLMQAWRDWFANAQSARTRRKRLLVVEDSHFFRQLLVPALAAQGFEVTAAGSAAEALRLRDAGLMIDAIISDIEMPDMDGLGFARCVREGGAWAELPMIALSGRASPSDEARGREAGFTDYCHKFERATLMESLKHCLSEQALA
jgi:two-component system chemotaxis sensor kinase CheA